MSAAARRFPRIIPADDARIRAEEEKTRRALEAASTEGGRVGDQAPIVKAIGHGRNDMVTIQKGEETQTLKYKKAEALLSEGWIIA
jgi:hypothetical protein